MGNCDNSIYCCFAVLYKNVKQYELFKKNYKKMLQFFFQGSVELWLFYIELRYV